MDVVRALVRAHGLEVHHVSHGLVVVDDAVGAEQVARVTRAAQGDVDVVALDHRDQQVELARILQAPHLHWRQCQGRSNFLPPGQTGRVGYQEHEREQP